MLRCEISSFFFAAGEVDAIGSADYLECGVNVNAGFGSGVGVLVKASHQPAEATGDLALQVGKLDVLLWRQVVCVDVEVVFNVL